MWSERDEKYTRAGEQRLGCSLWTQTLWLWSWVLALGVVLLLPRSSGSEGRALSTLMGCGCGLCCGFTQGGGGAGGFP